MATVLGQVFLDTIAIMEINGNPTVSGVEANLGSLAIETGSGNMWRKVGTSNTDWVEVFVNQSAPGGASTLRLQSGGNAVNITIPSLVSNVDLTLPGVVGVEGQQLTFQSSGQLQWSNQDSFHPGIITEKYYGSPDLINAWGTQAVTSNRIYASLLYIPHPTPINRIGCEVTTAAAGSQVRLGLYNLNSTDGVPGNLIVDGGAVSTATTGLKEVIVNVNLSSGWYYIAMATSGTPTLRSIAVNTVTMRSLLGVTAPNTNNQNLNSPFTFGALPSVFPIAVYTAIAKPWLWVRRV